MREILLESYEKLKTDISLNILILGSEGFIGSNAVKYFRKRGYIITCADIVLKQAENYLLINPEIADFSNIFSNQKYDYCINATGAANVQLSFTYPAMDFALNSTNVYNILDSIRRYNGGCKFINISSAAVYGNPELLPVKESASLRPVSPYGFHKMYSEQICREFYELYRLHTISLRIFSAYGEGLKKQLFWDLYKKTQEHTGSIELFGTGNETRDFVYIDDIMQAIQCIISKADFTGEAINIASGVDTTIDEAVNFFLEAINAKVTVKYSNNGKLGDPLKWSADISSLKTMGFVNRFSLQDGIRNYCNWLTEKK